MSFPQEARESRHTCAYCQKLVIDPNTSSKSVERTKPTGGQQRWIEFRNTFQYTVAELLQGSKNACPIFERIVAGCVDDDDPFCDARNNHRSIDVHIDLTSATSELQETAADVRKAKISCRWTDTSKCLMSYEGIRHNTYAFEAESGMCTVHVERHFKSCSRLINGILDDPAGLYVLSRPSYPCLVSEFTFRIIRAWLQKCEDHAECTAAIRTIYDGGGSLLPGPSRLLYIDLNAGPVSKVKIVDANGTEKYTALSYCWGKDSSMQLLCSNVDVWKEELPCSELPATIQDAISTTRNLGLEHLWVDRICIIQDDHEDKKKELSSMARIYQRSFLTISAASAPSAIDGFLQYNPQASAVMRNTRMALGYRCPDGTRGTVGMKTLVFRDEEYLPDMKAVDERAWTMQEQMLSTRIMHFCTNMLFWKCLCANGGHMYKEGAAAISTDRLFMDPNEQPFMDRRTSRFEIMDWNNVVRDYIQRKLSFPADKLVAVSALAEKFAEVLQTKLGKEHPRYLAGLWEHDLKNMLCWHLSPNLASPQRRTVEYRAPSWSWASIDGAVVVDRNAGYAATACKIVACDVELASASMPYQSVLSGHLTLVGRLREDIWDRKRQKLLGATGRNYTKCDEPDGLVDAIETNLEEDEYGTIPVFCLLMGENGGRSGTPYGLILMKDPGNSSWYRRLGYFELELFESSSNIINFSFKDCQEQIITIV